MTRKSLTVSLLLLSAGVLAQPHSAIPTAAEMSAKAPATHAVLLHRSVARFTSIEFSRLLHPETLQPRQPSSLSCIASKPHARRRRSIKPRPTIRKKIFSSSKPSSAPDFTAEAFPLTAELSAHLRKDESAADSPLKKIYRRPRPYQVDSTLHPVCPLNPEPTSYPSGHSLSGYLLAFTLVQLIPEKRQQILDRADEYVHNRLICGVHYASDTQASRMLAYAIFGSLAASHKFQQDLAAASEETRRKLGLPLVLPQQ